MTKKYGDIVHLSAFGQSIIVLGSAQAVTDLMEKRSSTYSGRYHLTMLHDLMGFDWALSLLSYNEKWRRHRKMFHHYFGAHAAEAFKPIQQRQSQALLKRISAAPDQFFQHVRHTTSATIMEVTYGFDVKEENDEWVNLVEEAVHGYSLGGTFGQFVVDILPILKHVPAWIPGANFQKVAAHYRKLAIAMRVEPFEAVKAAVNSGTARPSAAASMIEHLRSLTGPFREEEEKLSQNCSAMAYGAGADTTTAALQSFLVAMVLYPEVQRKAQAELDAVVGQHRPPAFDDRGSLPYVEALIKETLRWQMVAPLGKYLLLLLPVPQLH
ncbi:hypothetical protein EIP91_012201 [Steccherinum ochraceum]|uniref:Cytochrome P450 n=1 Tax=Steccherinum ochraceum TaxID=92696 RepID=A0A4R0RJG9_9APHY|nr:hypothetical protein EIP91_012201 [Steccherinum ochraceum]